MVTVWSITPVCLILFWDVKSNLMISARTALTPLLKNKTTVKSQTVRVITISDVLLVIVDTIWLRRESAKKLLRVALDTTEEFAVTVCNTSNSKEISVILKGVWKLKDSNVWSVLKATKAHNLAVRWKTV